MKKLIAMLLCFAMVAAFGASAAFAAMPDPISAGQYARWANSNRTFVEDKLNPVTNILTKLNNYVKAYESVKYDSSKSPEQVNAAKEKLQGQLDDLKSLLCKDDEDIISKLAHAYAQLNARPEDQKRVEAAVKNSVESLFKANSVTSISASQWKTIAQTMATRVLMIADRQDVEIDYYLSSGTKMDYNAWVIGQAQVQATYNRAAAEKAAATAKAAALTAQATAKALIADTIKTAQDAAATAVANAQKDAYNTLASNYADAVEAFWAEVENAWF